MAKAPPRILFNAKDHPAVASGYGIITKHLVPRLADRYGKDNVLVHAPVFNRDRIEDWNGIKILPGLTSGFEDDLLLQHYKKYQCNMLLQVGDWVMLKQIPTWAARDEILWVQWAPFDFVNPPPWVKDVIRLALKVVPFTQYAERQFRAMGLTTVEPAIWLGIEPKIWFPQDRRRLPQVMTALGFAEDTYNILIVQANQVRKNVREQLEAIKLFRQSVPEAKPRLYLHSHMAQERALDLDLKELGLEDITLTVDQYVLACGGLPEEQMAGMFNCADVVMDCCFEGFGYSTLQAQAVGVPAIILEEGPGPELTRFGIQVPAHHLDRNAAVQKPVADPQHIAQALIELYQQRGVRSDLSPRWVAEHFNWDTIAEQWFRVIEDTMQMRETYSLYLPQPSARLQQRAQELVELPS